MHNAAGYDSIASGIFAPLFPVVADAALKRTGKTGGRMLDIGCGGGHLGFAIMKRAPFEGWFLDISEEAVTLCQKRAYSLGFAAQSRYTVGDVHNLPYNDNSFDLIVSRGSMGFWGDYATAFKEIVRVLAPGGKTYIGKGLGNRATMAGIKEKMQIIEPGWPANLRRIQRHMATDAVCDIFNTQGFRYEVVENEEEGRWFILTKPVK